MVAYVPPPRIGPPMVDLALALAKGGYHVFPLLPNGKEPFPGSRGFLDATTDLDRIRRWWQKHSDANIGISCGASGLIVVDLDVKPDKHGVPHRGPENWAALVERVGLDDEPFARVLTPTNGYHLYWRGSGVKSSIGTVGEGIDIRAEGGYVVAPGSVINGGTYLLLEPR